MLVRDVYDNGKHYSKVTELKKAVVRAWNRIGRVQIDAHRIDANASEYAYQKWRKVF